jgi:RalA-binding protein 1
VDLLSSDEYWDPHAIAGLLKSFLRELPASILTRELHLRFLSVIGVFYLDNLFQNRCSVYRADFVDPQERIQELSHLIASLPIANYSLLRALTAHLILIVQNAGVNKMTMRNVGIVFSPTLGIPAGVFSLMLGEFNRVFNVDGLDEDSQDQGDNTSAAEDPSRRNSRQYTDAAADQLLGLSGRTLTCKYLIVPSCGEGGSSCGPLSSCRRRTIRRRQHIGGL